MLFYSDTVQRLWVCWCRFYKNPTLKLHKHAEAGGMKIVSAKATWPRIQCIPIACSPTDKARWKEDSKDVSKGLLKYCWVYEHSGLLNPGEQERKVPVSLTMPPRQGAISVGESIISVETGFLGQRKSLLPGLTTHHLTIYTHHMRSGLSKQYP